jgi:Na+-translocating ferredoxin:NAD+ oxidoreductase RNF subunit RnfB
MTGIPVLDSALILGGVGLFFGFVIALVNKRFRVWEDPRIVGVEEMLPSTNCGGRREAAAVGLHGHGRRGYR